MVGEQDTSKGESAGSSVLRTVFLKVPWHIIQVLVPQLERILYPHHGIWILLATTKSSAIAYTKH
jgi:hypothetical protein